MFGASAILTILSGVAQPEVPPPTVVTQQPEERDLPAFSSDLLDPDGFSRFHLITRATFSDGENVFSNGSAWSAEARAHLRVSEGIAISTVIPLGFFRSAIGATRKGFLGNIAFGGTAGHLIDLSPNDAGASRTELRIGGGLDFYLPTAPSGDSPELLYAELTVAAIRAYEPHLYIPRLLSFRTRLYADIQVGPLQAGLELGLVPGWTVKAPSQDLVLFSGAGRVSLEATDEIEPFVELGAAKQISGDGDISPPLLLTAGLRIHIAGALDPAIFASFNFVTPSAVILGIDLASAFRTRQRPPRDENRDDYEDFLDIE